MKYLKICLLTIFLFLITSLKVDAYEACTQSEMERLKELAKNVEFKPSYEISYVDDENKNVEVNYKIQIINFDSDLRIEYTSKYEEEDTLKSDTKEITNLADGDKFTFKIYSYTTNLCTDEILKTVTVDLPKVNDYYYFNKEKCDDNKDFKYCKEFMNTDDLDFEDIDKEFEEYLNPNIEELINKMDKKIFIYIGIGVGVIVVGTIVIVCLKKKKKDDL